MSASPSTLPPFHAPVWQYMAALPESVGEDAPLTVVNRRLEGCGVSGLLVTDAAGLPLGTISRTDLLREGRAHAERGGSPLLLRLVDGVARDAMTQGIVSVPADAPLGEAARRMAGAHVHRVFVEERGKIAGIVTTREILREIAEQRVATPIQKLMHDAVVVVPADAPVRVALQRMRDAGIRGIVVLDRNWPVGVFAQEQALEARFAAVDEPVEHWMEAGFHCLPMDMPVHRAARQSLAIGSRRILAMDASTIRGILSELDLARAAALALA